jgi:hypothetical protein
MDEDEDYLSDSDCSYDSRREKEMDAANMLSSLRNVSGAELDPELIYSSYLFASVINRC